jgi:hypothetical protein
VAKLIQVIVAEDRRGAGVEGNPFRLVTQYWSTDGGLLAEVDPCPSGRTEPSTALLVDVARLRSAIRWALGEEGEFPLRPEGKGAYWWRTELRRRAGIAPP